MTQQGFGIPTPNEDDEGTVSVVGTVEVANDVGNPLPVVADLTKVGGAAVTLGQKPSTGSIPVVLPTDQIVTGTFLSETDQPEDAPHVSGHIGSFILGVRNDADAVRTSADGDYSPVSVDSTGRLKTVGPLTDTQLRTTPVPVSGTVTVANPTANPETGLAKDATLTTHFGTDGSAPPAVLGAGTGVRGWLRSIYEKLTGTIAVTGPVTDAQLRATAVPVSGPVTDVQLRATAIPVNGPLTDTQLRATPVPVSGTVAISNPTANPETGLAKDATLTTHFGTDGTAPPAVLGGGTGTRGWLRSIYEKLTGTIAVTGTFWQATQPVTDNAAQFWRILNKRYADTEEARYDIPASLVSASIYTGVAPNNTATNAASWIVIRAEFDSNAQPSRHRIRTGVAWDSRASGWT